MPPDAELPSARRLLRSTLVAMVAAAVILVAIVLPAEYAIDPTGIGRILGLTEMGEVKAQLAREAAADAAASPRATSQPAAAPVTMATPSTAAPPAVRSRAAGGAQDLPPIPAAAPAWREEQRVTLAPGQGAEIKLVMKGGQQAQFRWTVEDGAVNFDTHADGGGESISYEKGRGVRSDEGVLTAAFDGNHGWFWRNRGDRPVTVILRVRGEYSKIKRLI